MNATLRYARQTALWIPALAVVGYAASRLVEAVNGSTPPGLTTPLAGFAAMGLVMVAAFASLSD